MKRLSAILLVLLLEACASTPPTSVHQPMTARPRELDLAHSTSGSIYQVASARPLFEDRRPRFVGDTLTINIQEKNSASSQSKSKADKTGGITGGINALNVYPLNKTPMKNLVGMNTDANLTSNFEGSGNTSSQNDFIGDITVTVIEVYPNGNLLVSGEKQVSIGQQQEFIRLSGVVNPMDIVTQTQSVSSARVADARIEYKSTGYISEAQTMGWLARFFLSVLPF